MSEQDSQENENVDKSGVLSFRTSDVTKKRIQEILKGSGKKADDFLSEIISRAEQKANQVDLPNEWRTIEQQILSALPLLHSTWNQTSTLLQQERADVEKLKALIEERNIKYAEKLVETDKKEKEFEKKLDESLKAEQEAESKFQYEKTRADQATSIFNAMKSRADELDEIVKKQTPIVEKYNELEDELLLLKKEVEHTKKVQQHELENEINKRQHELEHEKKRLILECQEKMFHEKSKHLSEKEDWQKKLHELNLQIENLRKENHATKESLNTEIQNLTKENIDLKNQKISTTLNQTS